MDPKLEELLKTIDRSGFSNEPFVNKVEKPWGYEIIFTPGTLPYTGKIIHINVGKRLSLQIHDIKRETQMLVNGECDLIQEDANGQMQTVHMEKNKGYTVAVGQKHRLAAVTDCDVFEVSSSEAGNTFRLDDDYARSTETEEMRKDPNRGWNG